MTISPSPSHDQALRPSTRRFRPAVVRAVVFLGMLGGTVALGQVAAPPPPAPAAADPVKPAKPEKPKSERLTLSTSDGFTIAAWYYAAEEPEAEADEAPAGPPAVVILLHDLGGSHTTVEPLALDLQSRGIAVVAPDLRGHGDTSGPGSRGEADADGKSLKKEDFATMALTGGGRVRDQAANRGDVEAVRNWIKEKADAGVLDAERLFVVGSGVGAVVAAYWTVADAAWPDLASGPQGRQVRGLVLVSPAWTTRGFTVSPSLASEPVRRSLPILVIAGAQDADAVKLYDQLKRQRPDGWSEKRAGQPAPTKAAKLADAARATLYLRQFDSGPSGDRLAALVPRAGGAHPAAIIAGFITAVTNAGR